MSTEMTIPGQAELDANVQDIAGQVAASSQRIYKLDTTAFAHWLLERGLTPHTMTRQHAIEYRLHLQQTYARATANRMFTIARRLMAEYVNNHQIAASPFESVKGFKAGNNETPHTALDKSTARELLNSIDITTGKGLRDYALLCLLLKSGIRRAECAAILIGDIGMQSGHHILIIQHGKGDNRRIVKLRVDVHRAIETYLKAIGRSMTPAFAEIPLFVSFVKGDKPTTRAIGDKMIETMVKEYSQKLGIEHFTPHGARASFATIAIEGGASLHSVQYAMGHADPRTTERYQKRKLNLDKNAVDELDF